jgi:ribosomal protein S4
MARYTGPRTKIARKFGEPIFGPDKVFEKKNYPPGMHGNMRKRKKTSEYGVQLQEKQKAKFTYGVLEGSSQTCLKRHHVQKVLLVKLCFNYLSRVLTMWFSVWESHQHVLLQGSLSHTGILT